MKVSPRALTWGVLALRLGVTVALIYLISRTWEQAAGETQSLDWGLLILSALLYPISFALILVVWHLIMQLQAGSTNWRRDAAIYCYSNLVRSLPFGFFWRIAGRVVGYDQERISRSATIAASLWEVVLHAGAATFILLFALALRPVALGEWFWIFAAVIVLLLALLTLGRIRKQFSLQNPRGVLASLARVIREHAPVLGQILVLNTLTWLVAGAMLLLQVRAVSPLASFDYLDALQTWLIAGLFGYLAVFMPFLDYGAKEATMAVLLAAHLSPAFGLIVAILYRLTFTISDVVWSLVGWLILRSADTPAERVAALATVEEKR